MPRRFFSLSFDYVHVINYLTTRNNAAPPIKSNPPVTTHNGSESVNYSRAPYDTNVYYSRRPVQAKRNRQFSTACQIQPDPLFLIRSTTGALRGRALI